MNNVTFGGTDPRSGEPFAYYETIGGGMGARPEAAGLDAGHTNMSNSLNTPVEALEHQLPLRMHRYSVRARLGGPGSASRRPRHGKGVRVSHRYRHRYSFRTPFESPLRA